MKMKVCNKCKKDKILSEYYTSLGGSVCKQCIRDRSKDWRENNRDYYLKIQNKYRLENADKVSLQKKQIYHTRYKTSPEHHIKNTYRLMKWRTKTRDKLKGLPLCSKEEFMSWCSLNKEKHTKLFKSWVKSGYEYKLVPSIDRIDSSKGYTIDNLQWLTQIDNRLKQ